MAYKNIILAIITGYNLLDIGLSVNLDSKYRKIAKRNRKIISDIVEILEFYFTVNLRKVLNLKNKKLSLE